MERTDSFCRRSEQREDRLRTIRELGRVVVITSNHSQYLHTYRGHGRGFEYELTKAFADYLGVDLEVKTLGWGNMIQALNQGRGDLAAAGIVATPFRQRLVDFSDGFLSIQPRVVIHRDSPALRGFEDLSGKTIHVKKRSAHEERLHELREEGLDMTVELHEGVPTEELIRRVARREIEMTMADSH
ncbi:MAG: transporter substrate-binding domain-containing protein, partial [candidate division Zixibacteria bacterium]|nr:transporter substrate-binding domain-containing protein [candidate division Zixibacteria bacterium]